jgi:hypothetical protein
LRLKESEAFTYSHSEHFRIDPKSGDLHSDLVYHAYPNGGLYIFVSPILHLTISAGNNGQRNLGGHAHNDKLSFDLLLCGENVVVDPGTYLYTPLPDQRNRFRATAAHNTLVVSEMEQNRWLPGFRGLFGLFAESKCELFEVLREDGVVVGLSFELRYRDVCQKRVFRIYSHSIGVEDYSNVPFESHFNRGVLFSPGYGKCLRNSIEES